MAKLIGFASLAAAAIGMTVVPNAKNLVVGVPKTITRSPADRCLEGVPPDPYTDEADEGILEACTAAVESEPADTSLRLAKGKAALSLDRTEVAGEEFQKAADGGACEAWAYLGDAAWHGRKEPDSAMPLYQKAVACGDPRGGKEILTEEFLSRSAYPELLRALLFQDIPKLNDQRFNAGSYVLGLLDALGEEYHGPAMSPDWSAKYNRAGDVYYAVQEAERGDAGNALEAYVYEKSLPIIYRLLFPALGGQALEMRRESMRKSGRADMVRMAAEFEVGALGPHLVLTSGVESFARARRSLWDWAKEKYPGITSLDDVRQLLNGAATR